MHAVHNFVSETKFIRVLKLDRKQVNLKAALFKVTVDLRGVFWGKQYSALCINGKYINLYIIGELV